MKTLKIVLSLVAMALIFGGCRYDFIAPPEVPEIPPGEEISFATQIVPIFTQDGCINCHNSGGRSPDLTSSNLYQVLVPAYVNTANPESSAIYDYPAPETSKHSWDKYSPANAVYVLTWIQQGAKNN